MPSNPSAPPSPRWRPATAADAGSNAIASPSARRAGRATMLRDAGAHHEPHRPRPARMPAGQPDGGDRGRDRRRLLRNVAGIDRLGILKVDAEGHDLDVLAGFGAMLADRRVDLCRGGMRHRAATIAIARAAATGSPSSCIAWGYGLFSLLSGDAAPSESAPSPDRTRRQRRRAVRTRNAVFVAEAPGPTGRHPRPDRPRFSACRAATREARARRPGPPPPAARAPARSRPCRPTAAPAAAARAVRGSTAMADSAPVTAP